MTTHHYINNILDEIGIDREHFADYLAMHDALEKKDCAVFYLHKMILHEVLERLPISDIGRITTVANSNERVPFSYDLNEFRDALLALPEEKRDAKSWWILRRVEQVINNRKL